MKFNSTQQQQQQQAPLAELKTTAFFTLSPCPLFLQATQKENETETERKEQTD